MESLRLYEATRATLTMWIERLEAEAGRDVSREGDGVSRRDGRSRALQEAVPVCGAPVQRIVYADNECNYCARCQTGGRLLADRVAVAAAEGRLAAGTSTINRSEPAGPAAGRAGARVPGCK